METEFYCKQTGNDNADGTGKATGDGMEVAETAEPKRDAAMDAGEGIDLGTEDEGNFVKEDVADDAAACSGKGTHDDGDPHGLAGGQCLLDADNCKHAETKGVEEKPCVVAANDMFLESPNKQERQEGDAKIDGVLHPENGYSEHHIAKCAASDCCGKTYDEGAEKVEILCGGQTYAGDGEGECTDVVKDYDEIVVERQYLLM